MSSMKCRCESDDRLEIIHGNTVRVSDGKQHLCEYQIDNKKDSVFDPEKLNEIDECLEPLCAIEKIVTKKLTVYNVTPNPAKVGMYMKFVYDKMI